jgi:hypothetical protein
MNKPVDAPLSSEALAQLAAGIRAADRPVTAGAQPFGPGHQAAVHGGRLAAPPRTRRACRARRPFTRGIYATMHRGRTWTQRQLIGLGTPAEYNERLLGILAQGATAVSLIPCNSVFRGYDMDESHIELLGTCGTVVNTPRTWTARCRAWTSARPRAR